MAETQFYTLQTPRATGLRKAYLHQDLTKIQERLRSFETFLGQPNFSWYETDPNTGTAYGMPFYSSWPHLRITYSGAPYRMYVRDRIDQLRALLGVSVFPWKYTPGLTDFDNANKRCGIDARSLVEMLQAIGRPFGRNVSNKRRYMKHIKSTDLMTGVVTESDVGPTLECQASYSFSQNIGSRSGFDHSQTKDAYWHWDIDTGTSSYENGSLEVSDIEFANSGTVYETYSKFLDFTDYDSEGQYDWVEKEGASYLMVFLTGEMEPEETERIEGSYKYWAEWSSDGVYRNSGGHARIGSTPESHPYVEEFMNGGETFGDIKGDTFTPEFQIMEDGSVYPVIPSGIPIGNLSSDNEMLRSMRSKVKAFLDEYGGNVSLDSVIETHDRLPHGDDEGEVESAWGSALISTEGKVSITRQVSTSYGRTQSAVYGKSDWLIWNQPYIPAGNGGWPKNLEE